jgi:hypothetical protein
MLSAMSICHFCWTQFPTPEALTEHIAARHEGYRKRWQLVGKSRHLTITAPDGTVTVMRANDLRKQYDRLKLERSRALPASRPADAEPDVEPDAEPGPAVDGLGSSVRDNRLPLHRIAQMAPPRELVTRGAVEAAFTREFLAEMLREGSRVLAEWDGAGAPGVFSATESVQIASLIYDPTISLIIDRFGGKVDRFKMMLAGVIILAGKGRVHIAAISSKAKAETAARKARDVTPTETPEREAMHEAATPALPPLGSDAWYGWLRDRQAGRVES